MPQHLRIPSHYDVYSDPPDKDGTETLHFVSGHRRVRLRGHSFREFVQRVAPLLDGSRTVEEVERAVADVFAPDDLHACLEMLGRQGLLEDTTIAPLPGNLDELLRPQLNLFHDLTTEPHALQHKLLAARVVIIGLSGPGAACALALGASGLGAIDGVDPHPVSPVEAHGGGAFEPASAGKLRADAVADRLAALAPHTRYTAQTTPADSDDTIEPLVAGATFVVNCLDEGESARAYKLNRVCLKLRIPFTTVQAAGAEVILGPTVDPGKTACLLCYKMRVVACSDNPEAEFAFQSYLDRRRQDDSGRRANLAAGVAIAAQLAALEAVKAVTGLPPSARGRLQVLNLLTLATQTHLVLRKPWCPACFNDWEDQAGS
jgi:bacteriocin biosynthesis cyclodehydratase domain-containing protein